MRGACVAMWNFRDGLSPSEWEAITRKSQALEIFDDMAGTLIPGDETQDT
jgi:hypothetical protein